MKRASIAGGAFPTAMTERASLVALMRRLHPLVSGQELVRLGPKGDGGYLVPDDLAAIEACFSPGVSTVSGFEKDCAERGMKVFLADKSVAGPAERHELFHFTRKFVGVVTDSNFMTLDGWVAGSVPPSASDLLLQIDIEGYEYEVFLAASDPLMRRFRIIVAEFHDLDKFWSRPFFMLAARAFDKILQTHACVHLHPNNCCGSFAHAGLEIPRIMEFTFLRRDRLRGSTHRRDFPTPLDCDNTPNPPLPLPRCWYRSD